MTGIELVIFVLAMGFVSSALLSAIHKTAGGHPNHFHLSLESPVSLVWSFFICMFAGPYIILTNAFRFWRERYLPDVIFLFCLLISGLWSFCSGVLVVQLLSVGGVI